MPDFTLIRKSILFSPVFKTFGAEKTSFPVISNNEIFTCSIPLLTNKRLKFPLVGFG